MTHSEQPLVSLIVPCFNGAAYIRQALNSVAAQDYSFVEVIIVDDGSTDDTAEIVRTHAPYATLISRTRGGTGAARNSGVAASQGNLIAFMDADDLLHPSRLRVQVEEFQRIPGLGMCYSDFANFETASPPPLDAAHAEKGTQKMSGCLPGTVMLSRACWERVGSFNETLQLGEFLEWYLRLQKHGISTTRIERALYFRRIHHSNFSRQRAKYSDYARVLLNRPSA